MSRKSLDFKLTPEQQKMAMENINLARREAWRIQRTTGIEYSVLEGAAFLGLCKACHRFDPDSGYKFSSLATPTIRGEILHWVRDKTYAMRLSHKMRENWIKGRRMLFDGHTDIQIAKILEIPIEEWQETRSACSGPPLELKDQAMPSDPLEPDEMDFKCDYRSKAEDIIGEMSQREYDMLIAYYKGDVSKPPIRQFRYLCTNLKNCNFI
jgi:RNA polymerase sigma factor (sigma-70 family)